MRLEDNVTACAKPPARLGCHLLALVDHVIIHHFNTQLSRYGLEHGERNSTRVVIEARRVGEVENALLGRRGGGDHHRTDQHHQRTHTRI